MERPSAAAKKRPAEQIRKTNQLYFAAVKDVPQVTLLDTYALFADAQGDAKPEEFPDLLHPNRLGYSKWLTALRSQNRLIRHDAPLSVLRAFRRSELEDLARRGALPAPEVSWRWAFRWRMVVKK